LCGLSKESTRFLNVILAHDYNMRTAKEYLSDNTLVTSLIQLLWKSTSMRNLSLHNLIFDYKVIKSCSKYILTTCNNVSFQYHNSYKVNNSHLNTICNLYMISSFRREVYEIWVLLGYYAAYNGNYLLTFRENISVPSSRAKILSLEDETDRMSRNICK
jgi:hypothetical protein